MARTNKAPLLLIRGLMRETRHWGIFVELLRVRLPQYDILALDVPGNGRLFRQSSPISIAAMTESLRSRLTKQNSQHQLQIIGLSMGGMIALDWMHRYPEEIAGAVLINSSVRPLSPFYQRMRWQAFLNLLTLIATDSRHRERMVLRLTSSFHGNNACLLEQWLIWQAECPVSLSNALRQLLAAARFKLKKPVTQPVLLLSSAADRLVDDRCSLRLQRYLQCAAVRHERAGHDIALDDPYWLSFHIAAWLQQNHVRVLCDHQS